MRVLSLFSGGGLGDLGLELAGMKIVCQVEIDEYCQKILSLRWPEVTKFKDIKTFDGNPWRGAVDLIAGGFPCQPFSSAGRREGTEDKRHLWPEMLRVIREVKPRWVLAENVPGLLSISDGRVFGEVVRGLAASGYCVEWDCIPASALGAHHQRDRVWIVAHSRREHGAGTENHGQFEKSSRSQNAAEFKRPNRGTSKRVASNADGSREQQSQRSVQKVGERLGNGGKNVADSLCEQVEWFNKRRFFDQLTGGSSKMGDSASERFPDWTGGKMGQPSPLTEFERSSGKNVSDAPDDRVRRRVKQSQGRKKEGSVPVREIERDFRGVAYGVANRVDRLKLLGNGQVVQVVEWIGKRIMEFNNSVSGP